MKIQVRSLAIALAIAGPLTVAATAKSSAAPINGMSIKAAVPAPTCAIGRIGIIPTLRTGAIPPITTTDIPPPPPITTRIPTIGPIHHIGTPTAGGDARHPAASGSLSSARWRNTVLPIVRMTQKKRRRTTMVDRSGLRLVGFIFASVTLAVMLTTTMVVKGYSDGV